MNTPQTAGGTLLSPSSCSASYQALFNVLVAIVNTAQTNPDRCMADVCNDNFAVYGVLLRAEMTEEENTPVRIEPDYPLNAPREAGAVAPASRGCSQGAGMSRYVTRRWPHPLIRRLLREWLVQCRRPRRMDGDPPFWPRHSWNALAVTWWRLLVHGVTEDLWD